MQPEAESKNEDKKSNKSFGQKLFSGLKRRKSGKKNKKGGEGDKTDDEKDTIEEPTTDSCDKVETADSGDETKPAETPAPEKAEKETESAPETTDEKADSEGEGTHLIYQI